VSDRRSSETAARRSGPLPWSMAAALPVLAAIGAVAAAQAPDPRFEAFRATCGASPKGLAALEATAAREGWRAAGPDAHPGFAAVLAAAQAAREASGGAAFAGFSKALGGRAAYLVVTRLKEEAGETVGCHLYAFEATAPLPAAPFEDWLGEAPAGTVDEPGAMIAQVWEAPARLAGVVEVQNGFVPVGSPMADVTGFSGLALSLTALAPAAP